MFKLFFSRRLACIARSPRKEASYDGHGGRCQLPGHHGPRHRTCFHLLIQCSVFCYVLFFCCPFLSSPVVSGSSNLLGPCALFSVKSLRGGRNLEYTNHHRPYIPSLAFENFSRLWMWADSLTGRFGLQKGLRLEWFLRLSYFPQGIGDYVLINFISFTLLRRFE